MNNEKFIRRWEKTRQKGDGRYVLTNGIAVGIGMFVGSVISRLINLKPFDFYMHFGYFIGGFIGGIIGAIINWPRNERKYNELINSNLNK